MLHPLLVVFRRLALEMLNSGLQHFQIVPGICQKLWGDFISVAVACSHEGLRKLLFQQYGLPPTCAAGRVLGKFVQTNPWLGPFREVTNIFHRQRSNDFCKLRLCQVSLLTLWGQENRF